MLSVSLTVYLRLSFNSLVSVFLLWFTTKVWDINFTMIMRLSVLCFLSLRVRLCDFLSVCVPPLSMQLVTSPVCPRIVCPPLILARLVSKGAFVSVCVCRCHSTVGQNRKKKHRQNSHPIIHFPTSEGVSKVSKRASE